MRCRCGSSALRATAVYDRYDEEWGLVMCWIDWECTGCNHVMTEHADEIEGQNTIPARSPEAFTRANLWWENRPSMLSRTEKSY